MRRDQNIEGLRQELVNTVQHKLSPLALKYKYDGVPLEVHIKWRPVVLVLGNYSSGKSTLINELLGAEIQDTGQAPTDDSFTVITCPDHPKAGAAIKIVDQRDGKVLLYDDQYPFEGFRKFGERFAAHFRLLKVNSPILKDLAIIDTPGMLDSSSKSERGYDYQQVIGELAQVADLILVMFDPHKAGTIAETHKSLSQTLPLKTFENRVLFVLNRIDECDNFEDLLRVYGTLCWNLGQMTMRKDMPPIHMTFSEERAVKMSKSKSEFLDLLKNQRSELIEKIKAAPRYRLDHLASYIETHGERLGHYLEALQNYAKRRVVYQLNFFGTIAVLGVLVAATSWIVAVNAEFLRSSGAAAAFVAAGAVGVAVVLVGLALLRTWFLPNFHEKQITNIDNLTPLETQNRSDSWAVIKERVRQYLLSSHGEFSYRQLRSDRYQVETSCRQASVNARKALAELGTLPQDDR
jgi:EH domain-containing protein 1